MTTPVARFLNLPNTLSLTRIPLGVVAWAARQNSEGMMLIAFTAGATDILDGWSARRSGLNNPTGVWLDPLCDKIFVLALLSAVVSRRRPPAGIAVLIATREILQASAALFLGARSLVTGSELVRMTDLKAAPMGKLCTGAQFAAIIAILAKPRFARPLALVAAITGAGAAALYFRRFAAAPRNGTIAPPAQDWLEAA